ncbi:hypothetical protein EV700_0509 [Fluviicoccus keumensis]|uniref:Uncharacterized protein n=1 Tax=Fluviicoccus keumensis TaxID=1435465 RepID=A0A4V6MG11_9GAMM|nr:hypothetical protein EV700_0509 [Fluviicoccus keumensis]
MSEDYTLIFPMDTPPFDNRSFPPTEKNRNNWGVCAADFGAIYPSQKV